MAIEKNDFKNRIYQYVLRMVRFLSGLSKTPEVAEIKGQLLRSSTSIGANYFEAQGAISSKDYKLYFTYCLKSANESIFWLSLLNDAGFVSARMKSEWKWLIGETQELARIFAASIITMNKRAQSKS